MDQKAPEGVRLVIWDLDETFWGGTLTEGGVQWREETADIVRTLSARGIINAICSKNDFEPVDRVLREHGLRDYFVFPSISWDPKGPRLAALVEAVQLRPETIMFIDDNPMNRAEARHFVPALQIEDETFIPNLLSDPRFKGKSDPGMTRLEQYRLLERRQADQEKAGGDTAAFLRESGITVTIEHDLEKNIDRAIELINRTNQLNFTKSRLPEDPEQARDRLRRQLQDHTIQAGIIRVRDNYGDYGYCGLYMVHCKRRMDAPRLLQFAFSCRTLGMGVETWVYRHLGRPLLDVQGEVLTDVINDARPIDWIRLEVAGAEIAETEERPIAYALARGGCDMRALAHYFHGVTGRVVEEFDDVRHGMFPMVNGAALAVYSIRGVPSNFIEDAALLGFRPEDFRSEIASPPAERPAIWILSFTQGASTPQLRHKETGLLLPARFEGSSGALGKMFKADPATLGAHGALIRKLREKFDFHGPGDSQTFGENLRIILAQAPSSLQVFIILANEIKRLPDGTRQTMPDLVQRNATIRRVAAEFANVTLIDPIDHLSAEDRERGLEKPHHFDRTIYFKLYKDIFDRVAMPAPAGREQEFEAAD